MRCWPFVVAIGLLAAPAFAGAGGVPVARIYEEEFHLRSDRRFELPSWRAMEAEMGDLAAADGCRALGVDCSDAASGPGAAGRFLKRPIDSDAYRGTARLLRVRDGAYYAKFVAPEGYSVCRAGIYLKSGVLEGSVTFAGSIQRSGADGVAVYAALTGPDAAAGFRLLVLYVPHSEVSGCWPDQTILFVCEAGRCAGNRAYPQIDLR